MNLSTSSIENIHEGFSIHLFPNPASTIIHIDLKSDKQQELNLQIIDLNGKKTDLPMILKWQGADHKSIDISSLSTGNYIIQITNKSGNLTNSIQMIKQ